MCQSYFVYYVNQAFSAFLETSTSTSNIDCFGQHRHRHRINSEKSTLHIPTTGTYQCVHMQSRFLGGVPKIG